MYQERIAEIAESQPLLLAAHAYTQHMALLAGGQRTRQLVLASRPPTTGDAGTSLFVFEVLPMQADAGCLLGLHMHACMQLTKGDTGRLLCSVWCPSLPSPISCLLGRGSSACSMHG